MPLTNSAPEQPPRLPGWTMRVQLAIFATSLVLPILAFIGFLLWQYASAERGRLEREALATARSISVSIDRELTALVATLDVLSLSTRLQAGDLEAFYGQAKELERRQGVIAVLRDPSGQQLLNVRLPFGSKLPVANLPVDSQVMETKRAQISDLFMGAVAHAPLFTIVVPVQRNGEVVYLLSLRLDVERVRKIIEDENPPPGTSVAVIDRNGKILARSSRQEELVGRDATPAFMTNATGSSGTWQGAGLNGTPVFGAYARSPLSGWRVGVGVSNADLNQPIYRSLCCSRGSGWGCSPCPRCSPSCSASGITAPMHALAARAAALGRGETVEPLSTPLVEANQVGLALVGAAAELREREAELRETSEEVQRFAYIVSHDLRAPLVNIMGFTSELESLRPQLFGEPDQGRPGVETSPETGEPAGPPQDPELMREFDEALNFIRAAIAKMDGLIGAILKLSREGRRSFKPERLDMVALVQGLADAQRHQADSADATVVVGKLPPVLADRLAVEQIFGNLIDNAVKYLDRSRPGRIEVTGQNRGGWVMYTVRDNGRGIGAQDRVRVFELFRRAGVQDRPGEGIGLAHVRTLVRALGGRIDLESELGRGTTFTIQLPRSPAKRPAGDK